MPEPARAEQLRSFLPDGPALAEMGGAALRPHLELVTPELTVPGLTGRQAQVLELISQGHTGSQVARQADIPYKHFKYDRTQIRKYYGDHGITVAVNRAIYLGHLPIEVAPDQNVLAGLTPADKRMIKYYARGGENKTISEATGKPIQIIEQYHDRMLKRFGAWSRPHAVRRAYELGVLNLPGPGR